MSSDRVPTDADSPVTIGSLASRTHRFQFSLSVRDVVHAKAHGSECIERRLIFFFITHQMSPSSFCTKFRRARRVSNELYQA
jgi:hypothetical protein